MFRGYKTDEPATPPLGKVWWWYDDTDEKWKYKLDDGMVYDLGSGGALSPTNTSASPTSLDGSTSITPSGVSREIRYVKSDSGAVTNSVNPQIAAGTVHGQEILLVGTDDTDTIKFIDGNGIKLNGDCTLRDGSTLLLFWDQFVWLEISRNDK